MSARTLPMFPLGTVLVPHAPLPLHVFEARYRAMMRDVLAADGEFGVVLIERGSEVGGGDQRTHVGTIARVAEAAELDDGRWAVIAVGTSRITVTEWLPDDPYPRAMVEPAPGAPWSDAAAALLPDATRAVRRALALTAELGLPAAPATAPLADDAEVAAWQLVAIAPLGALDRHRLLAVDDPAERLRALHGLMDEEARVLAQRLAGL